MKLTILIDNPKSWFVPFGLRLKEEFLKRGHEVFLCYSAEEIKAGDICFLLSCEKIIKNALGKNRHNIVIHSSALPAGRGFSPLTWQVLEGRNEITTTLFEAAEEVDSGEIYIEKTLKFEGHELNDEMKLAQGETIINMALEFVDKYREMKGRKQEGSATYYRKRSPKDSMLDINKSIREQFNLLRTVDNERYPAYFENLGKTYILKIFKKSEEKKKS